MRFAVLFAAVGVAVFLTACGPELAQTPYTQEETEWMNYLEGQYSGWRPPQTPPPVAGAVIATPRATVAEVDETLVFEDSGKGDFELVNDTVYVEPAAVGAPAYVEYTVKKGDTLGSIAHQHYKKAGLWKKIYNANTSVISNPNKLKIGTVLRIPQQ
mgnify:CR=1 FL=1